MKFQIGDRVRFLDEEGEGTIMRIISKISVSIDLGDGLEIPVHSDELMLVKRMEEIAEPAFVSERPKEEISDPDEEKKVLEKLRRLNFHNHPSNKRGGFDVSRYAASLSILIVDLHVEKLTERHKSLSNGEKLVLQIRFFEKVMDEGVAGNYKKIIFIHGVGNGVLKKEILKRLQTYNQIEFGDADERSFGFGATEVKIL